MSIGLKRRLGAFTIALVAIVFAILIWRSKHDPSAEAMPSPRTVPYLEGNRIRYTAEFARRAELEFLQVTKSSLSPVISVTGTVTFDPERMAAVGSRIAGRVSSIKTLEGQIVKAGDVLAEIESAELGQAQAALIAARAHARAASVNEKREQELAEAKISANREAELAQAQAIAARAEFAAAEQRVRALGGTADGAAGILQLTTPIAGKVIERNVFRGQSVEATHTAFRVADLTRVWVELFVFERQVAAIHQGDAVDLFLQSDLDHKVSGSVAYVGDVIDRETRTAPVRVVVDQAEAPLRPGQSVLAKIHTSAKVRESIVVARNAVTSVDGNPTVFVSNGPLSVEPRSVRLGGQDGDRVEVVSGIEEGERIAVSGVFALKSEIFR